MHIFSLLKIAKAIHGGDGVVDSNMHITTKNEIEKRKEGAKKFWKDVGTTERILGRDLTTKEV